MNDSDTQHLVRGSLLAKIGISIRGIVVLLLVGSVCLLTAIKVEIPKELYWLTSAAVGYYFGQQHQKQTNP